MTEQELIDFLAARQQENVSVEYKKSKTLDFKDTTAIQRSGTTLGQKHRADFAKDVAAMANAEGGTIYVGVEADDDGFPTGIDGGFNTAAGMNADGLEQFLLTNIHPKLESLLVEPIELLSKGPGLFAFEILVGRARSNAPHQTNDHRYHRRHQRTISAMEDNEVRDAMRRSINYGRQYGAAWNLQVELSRLRSAVFLRSQQPSASVPRESLLISVSNDLRSAGDAMVLLPKQLRTSAADVISEVDQYNSAIETFDPTSGIIISNRFFKDTLEQMLKNIEHLKNAVSDYVNLEG